MTEFIVLALALVPLFLLVPIIAKYQDIAHATQMASRYAAFDGLTRGQADTWKPEAQLASEVRRRFFSNTDAPVKTHDTAGTFLAHRNLFWRGPRGEHLIRDLDEDVSVSFGPEQRASYEDGFTPASDGTLFSQASRMGLEAPGIYTANVSVRLANLPDGLRSYEPFNAIDLAIMRGTSVLTNEWNAAGPGDTDERVLRGTNLRDLRLVGAAADAQVTPADILGGVRGPQLGQLDFWQDVVPADRLR